MNLQPLVYIVILNWNGFNDTMECLKSIIRINYNNFKVIIVDNGSSVNEAAKLKKIFKHFIYIENKNNNGFAKGNNQGIKLAMSKRAKFILLLNNDTVVKANFLSEMVNFAQNNKVDITNPKILYYGTDIIWAMGGKIHFLTSIPRMINQNKQSKKCNHIVYPPYASGCAMLIKGNLFKKIGLLNEDYFSYYEDTDLCYKAKKLKATIAVVPNSIIWHKVSQSTTNKNFFRIGDVQSYLLARNGLIYGYNNLVGVGLYYYFFAQFFIKFPLYIIFKVDGVKACFTYIRGLIDGIYTILSRKSILDFDMINNNAHTKEKK